MLRGDKLELSTYSSKKKKNNCWAYTNLQHISKLHACLPSHRACSVQLLSGILANWLVTRRLLRVLPAQFLEDAFAVFL